MKLMLNKYRVSSIIFPRILNQFRAALLLAGGLVIMAYLVGHYTPESPSYLTRDPASIGHLKFYAGLLSNLGIMMWASAAVVAFLGAAVMAALPTPRSEKSDPVRMFLLTSGFVSLWLAIDDALMLHEAAIPQLLHITENLGVAVIALVLAAWIWRFLPLIRATDYPLLAAAFVLFGISRVMSATLPYTHQVTFIKDSLKFMGIIFWLFYFFFETRRAILTRTQHPREP